MTTLRPLKISLLMVCLVGLLVGAFWFGWRFCEVRKETRDNWSYGSFSYLEGMLLSYHDEHGAFPPTKYQRKAGEPVHSWRVLLVPYTTQRFMERYSHYDFSQEWNSTNNLQVLGHMPHFSCYSLDGQSDIAHYLAIGENDEWPSRGPLRSRLITKGKDRFLLVEDPDSKFLWMEPKY